MRKVLLTSTGFDNENIKNKFLELVGKDSSDINVLFIISAANDPDSVRVLSGCLDDLTGCGISDNNIKVYDLDYKIDLNLYDAIYVCGGSTRHLIKRMNDISFKDDLVSYIDGGGVYVGVSAGSVCLSSKYENNMGIIDNYLDVHCDKGSENGEVVDNSSIYLTNNQALLVSDELIVFE